MKLSLFPAFSLMVILTIPTGCQQHPDTSPDPWPPESQVTKPWSRWWWLGSDVDRSNIERLMATYAEAGLGGMEIAPIYGVRGRESQSIEYLSPEWMDMLDACIVAAADHDMGIDMTLGTGWPFGGPQITHEEAAGKLILQQYDLRVPGGMPENIVPEDPKQIRMGASLETLMAWSGEGTMVDLTGQVDEAGGLHWDPEPGLWQMIAVFSGKTGQQVKRAAPGGEGLTMDHFSGEALDVYLARFDSAFANDPGTPVPAAGVLPSGGDHPKAGSSTVRCFFNDSYEVYGASWTPGFLDAFEEKRGYDLRAYLREFSGMKPGDDEMVARLKSDYRETMSELLLEQFTRPWTTWSHQHGSMTRNQAHGSPGNLIDLYAAVDIPECEIFGHRTFDIPGMRVNDDDSRNVEPNPMMLKLATSAAHITNKPYISNETFTWLGEHFKVALSQCKPEVEEAFLAGINHVFYHGIPYSPAEAAWPGWLFYASVHFGPTNSWWPHLEGLNSYISRCQSVLQSGQADNEVLVYWPVYDIWHQPEGLEMMLTVHNIEEWLVYPAIESLAEKGYSYDFISDALLKNVESHDGSLLSAGGEVKHSVLVVPECRFMPLPTLERILSLAREGGLVVFQQLPGDVPGWVDLEQRRVEFHELLSSLEFSDAGDGVRECSIGKGTVLLCPRPYQALSHAGLPGEQITRFGLKYTRRKAPQGYYYYLVNHTANPVDTLVPLQHGGEQAVILNPRDGRFGKASTVSSEEGYSVRVQLQPGEALFVHTGDQSSSGRIPPWPYVERRLPEQEVNGTWKLSFDAGGPVLPGPVELGSPLPWTSLEDDAMQEFSGIATYSVRFNWSPAGGDEVLLQLGKVYESASVRLNGTDLGPLWCIPFETRVGHLLREGANTLEISVANLMANRIRSLDRKGIPWRIFREINFVNIDYEPFDASEWEVEPSGLAGPVVLVPVELIK